jgi:ABC-2 type transport system ATP-binding protein
MVVPALEVRGLTKRFRGGRGIESVSLTVAPGSIVGFIGANGAGKSTTLRCILGLVAVDAGDVRLFGRPADKAARRRVGFLPEERGLCAHDRARDAIAFQARLKGIRRKEAFLRADELLARAGLGGQERWPIAALSKGNVQRVQILCALAHAPDLLILDEPLSGLDPIAQSDALSMFAEFRGRGGAILFSTHAMAAAEALCDTVVMLAHGRVAFDGAPQEASELIPHGAVVVTSDSARLIDAARALGGEARLMATTMDEGRRWRITVPPAISHIVLMRALAERSVPVIASEPIKRDLEGAFWSFATSPSAPQPRRAA